MRSTTPTLYHDPFLVGGSFTAPDLLFAAELFALDIDPQGNAILDDHPNIVAWLSRMQTVPGYDVVHAAWNHVVPLIREKWAAAPGEGFDPSWVADACREVLSEPDSSLSAP